MQLNFKIEGLGTILKNLRQISVGMTTIGSDQALIAAADEVVKDAKRLVPVRTGALKRNIARTDPRRGKVGGRTIDVGVKPPISRRAHFTEFGTVHNSAQPFLRPAMDSNSRRNVGLMGRVMNRFMESFGGGKTTVNTKLNIRLD
jgi:HK97 gp10 family phage protein